MSKKKFLLILIVRLLIATIGGVFFEWWRAMWISLFVGMITGFLLPSPYSNKWPWKKGFHNDHSSNSR